MDRLMRQELNAPPPLNNKQGYLVPTVGIPERSSDYKGDGFCGKASRRVVETETADRGAETRSRSARDREEEGESSSKYGWYDVKLGTNLMSFCPPW